MYQEHLERLSRTRLDDVLMEEGVIDPGVIADAQAEQELTGKTLSAVLLEREALDEWDLAKLVTIHYSLPFVDLTDVSLNDDSMAHLSLDFCNRHNVIPVDSFGERVFTLAVCEMPSTQLLNEIVSISGRTPFLFVSVRRQIRELLDARVKKAGGQDVLDQLAQAARQMRAAAPAAAAAPVADAAGEDGAPAVLTAAAKALQAAAADGGLPHVATKGIKPISMKLSATVPVASGGKRDGRRDWTGGDLGSDSGTAVPAEAERTQIAGTAWESIFDIGNDAVNDG